MTTNSATPISDTGIRGFLKWFQREQPALYVKVAPIISKKIPQAFSDYHQGGWRVAGLSRDESVKKLNSIYAGNFKNRSPQGLSDYSDYSGYFLSAGTGTSYASTPFTTSIDTSSFEPVSIDTATAANSGPSLTSITGAIGSVINTAAGAYLTAQQAQTQAQIVNTQLQRAAAGLPPLTTSLSSLGIPQVTGIAGSINTGTLLLMLGVGAALLMATKGGENKSA